MSKIIIIATFLFAITSVMAIAQPDTVKGGYRNCTVYHYEFKNGKIDSSSKRIEDLYKYDEKSVLTESIQYDTDGSIFRKRSYKYNDNGQLINRMNYDANGNFLCEDINTYDLNGNLIEDIDYLKDGQYHTKNKYKYNEQGLL